MEKRWPQAEAVESNPERLDDSIGGGGGVFFVHIHQLQLVTLLIEIRVFHDIIAVNNELR